MPTFQVATTTATLAASTAMTAIELRTASGLPCKIIKWWVDLNSSTSTDKPVLVQAGRYNAAVTTNTTRAASTLSYVGTDTVAQTLAGVNATVEGAGAANSNTESHYVLPQGGMYVAWETDDTAQWVSTGSFWRIVLTPGSAITSTTANVGVVFAE